MHYQSKQDLAMAYFPDNSKETASNPLPQTTPNHLLLFRRAINIKNIEGEINHLALGF